MNDDAMTMTDDQDAAAVPAPVEEGTDVVLDDMSEVETNEVTAHLVVKRNGTETEESFAIQAPAVIGRFDAAVGPVDVDLGPLPEGVYVSRKHARLVCEEGTWSIEDLGSSNGTFLLRDGNFERVETAELEDGSEIALGNARFVFHLQSAS